METKSNTGLVVVVTLLVVAVAGLIGFIVYDKVLKEETPVNSGNNNNVQQNEVTDKDYDLDDAKELVDKYYYNWGGFGSTTFEKMDQNDKMYIAYTKLNKSDFKKANCKSLYSGITADEYGVYNIDILNNTHACDSESKTVSYNVINKVYQKLFGSDTNIPKKAFGLGFDGIDYVSESNQFVVLNFYGGGDWPTPHIMYDVLSAKLSRDDELTINVGYVVFEIDIEKDEPYSPNFDSSITYEKTDDIEDNFIQKYSNKVTKLEFVFEKDNGNFVLKNFTNK